MWAVASIAAILLAQTAPAAAPPAAAEDPVAKARAGTGAFFSYDPAREMVELRPRGGTLETITFQEFNARVQALFANRTSLVNDPAHGWEAEFTTADGKAYLWYPGQGRTVTGTWRTTLMTGTVGGNPFKTIGICFKYDQDYTRPEGGPPRNEQCSNAVSLLLGLGLSERRAGDPFRLVGGAVPYKRDKTQRPAWPEGSSQ